MIAGQAEHDRGILCRVQWFYSQGSTQCGPVTNEEFSKLVREGQITGETMVWKDGMPGWIPLSELPATEATELPPIPPPAIQNTPSNQCVSCSKTFPESELVDVSGKRICATCKPVFIQKMREGLPLGNSSGLYRQGRDLVVETGAELPHRCVHCNAEGTWRKLRKFTWSPPWIWLTLFVCLLLAVVVNIATRKIVNMEVSLCPKHAAKRRNGILLGWALFALSIALFVFIAVSDTPEDIKVLLGLTSFALVIAAFAVGSWASSILSPKRIGKRAARFGRVSPEFIQHLPEWNNAEL